MRSADLTFEDIHEGESAQFTIQIEAADVAAFASLSGDENPLHIDEKYAGNTEFKGRVVHGMLLGAYVSRLVGMYLPGMRALLLKETLEFKRPARIGSSVTVAGVVAKKSESTRILEIGITISTETELLSTGTVYVRVLP